MKKIVTAALFVSTLGFCEDNNSAKPEASEPNTSDSALKVAHNDSVPSIIKKERKEDSTTTANATQSVVKNKKSISLACYKNGICQVRDVRTINVLPGQNKIIIEDLYPGLMEESLKFQIFNNEKISVVNAQFNKKDLSKETLLLSSIDCDIFYKSEGKVESGKLLNITDSCAVIEKDHKCFFIPLEQCMAVNENVLQNNGNNSLHLLIESQEAFTADLEICYLTPNINWKHICLVDVFEKLDRVDISSKAFLKNETDFDFENVSVVFNSFSPSSDKILISSNSSEEQSYAHNISLRKNSAITCLLKSIKKQNPKLEYVMEIPIKVLSNDAVQDLSVRNLLIIEEISKLGISRQSEDNSGELFVYYQTNNNVQSFLGKHLLASFVKDNNLILEFGATDDIIAQIQRTDFRKISDKQSEYGIKINLRNNKLTEVVIAIMVDEKCEITKKNFDLQIVGQSQKLSIKPNESKELHLRMRVSY